MWWKPECKECNHNAEAISDYYYFRDAVIKWRRSVDWRLKLLEEKVAAGNLTEIQQLLNQFNSEMFGYTEHEPVREAVYERVGY